MALEPYYNSNSEINEIGIDEVGRGPMFGRVYAAAVIFPKSLDLDKSGIKDSKKFTSLKKLNVVADYIKKNCISYGIGYEEHDIIDKRNIRNATYMAMHKAIKNVINNKLDNENNLLLVDGTDFKIFTYLDDKSDSISSIPHVCIKNGDNKYYSIAAASILAKSARDKYIEDLCKENPELIEKYDLLKNKGYGTKKHLDGIREHGITQWHRKTFGICKKYLEN